jgi:hexokinase
MVTYQSAYQQAQLWLQAMQRADSTDPQLGTLLEVNLRRLQQLQQLLQADETADQAEQPFIAQAQPLQTEINKQLRLLETDLIFLKAARQPATLQQRHQQIQTRLTLLLRYCEAILVLCITPE